MANFDLDNLKPELTAISEDEVKTPSIPVDAYIQEGENLRVWAEEDKDKLTPTGLDWTLVESLSARAGACREAQSLWARDYKSREELEKEWAEKSPIGFELRDNLLHAFRYAFRKESDLLSNVAIIAEGGTRDDMIQDLNDLAVLGKANTALLEAISFDVTLLDTAAQMSEELSELLAGAKSEQAHSSETFDLRNRAYTYLKMAIDEIRDCGKYVFWNDDDRIKGYISEYIKKYNRRKREDEIPGEAA